jgi:hypothetical protein
MSPSKTLIDAIVVCAELTQTQLSRPAATVFAQDLARYPEHQVLKALARCRRELKSRLSLADVISRLDDGRPGVEEAWAMIPRDENSTVVWTREMAEAYGIAAPLLSEGDRIGGRMAFKEAYTSKVQAARDAGLPVKWEPSLGHDPHGRDSVLIQAAQQGKLTADHVAGLLQYREKPSEEMQKLLELVKLPKAIEKK